MSPFPSLPDYERFIYTIAERFPAALASTLVLIQRGAGVAILQGELKFSGDIRLVVQEHLRSRNGQVLIRRYGYEIWHEHKKLYWYDSQPHPNNPDLAVNHPHHKHVPPDIKHNRIPAPGLSFTQPNLPFLITEIEQTLFRFVAGKPDGDKSGGTPGKLLL